MNNQSAASEFLAWLLQDPTPNVVLPLGGIRPNPESGTLGEFDLQGDDFDPFDSEELEVLEDFLRESGAISAKTNQLFEPGDQPAVHDRFYALLKNRLRAEIERNPPRFPWEPEGGFDYEAEELSVPQVIAPSFWSGQLQKLNLPVPMPENVLEHLLTQCEALVQTTLQEGARLVQAVEALFPGQSQSLNQLAGMVMTAPARTGGAVKPDGFPSHYDAANQAQQMALSLLAAREILQSLTLSVSAQKPSVEREWETAVGTLKLKAESVAHVGKLRVEGQLPCGGKLQLQGRSTQTTTAQRPNAGWVSVELFDLQPNQIYPLEVRLALPDQPTLIFAVQSLPED